MRGKCKKFRVGQVVRLVGSDDYGRIRIIDNVFNEVLIEGMGYWTLDSICKLTKREAGLNGHPRKIQHSS